jgi:hypothetical protein
MKRPLLLCLAVLLLPGVAHAESVSDVVQGLRNNPVYQSPGVDLVDADALDLRKDDPKLYVAALSATAASSAEQAHARAVDIGRALAVSNAVVLVITANKHLGTAEGSGAAREGVNAARALAEQLAANKGQPFDKEHVTQFVKAFQERLEDRSSSSAGSSGSASEDKGGGGGGLKILVVLALLGGAGFFLVRRSSHRKTLRQQEGLRADVEQLYNRLGSEVSLLSPGDNPVAKQALADASERYNSCGAALASADSPAEFAAARRTAVEGLTAARVARKELGLDPGPEIPLPPGEGPRLTGEQQLQVGDQTVTGSPDYAPGRQHYYGGGRGRRPDDPGRLVLGTLLGALHAGRPADRGLRRRAVRRRWRRLRARLRGRSRGR